MTYPIVFGTLAAGNQPASDFDTMFNVVGQQGALPCTGTGTNAISLTPGTNNYVPAAYTNGQLATFEAGGHLDRGHDHAIGGLRICQSL